LAFRIKTHVIALNLAKRDPRAVDVDDPRGREGSESSVITGVHF
jgi:hypothetical protein